eukprot:Phypoly_transcript_16172.p1 GENE.Phypoly_transcript_16172~~Phypoly_transcript_16172.p1  ORF type:complete len:107 (-),score=4.65 Phypoly_transcript_16172:29-349(-)
MSRVTPSLFLLMHNQFPPLSNELLPAPYLIPSPPCIPTSWHPLFGLYLGCSVCALGLPSLIPSIGVSISAQARYSDFCYRGGSCRALRAFFALVGRLRTLSAAIRT